MANIKAIKGTNGTTYSIVDRYSKWGGNNLLKNIPKSQSATGYNFLQLNLTENLIADETYTLQLWDVVLDSNSSGISPWWGGGSIKLATEAKPTNGYIVWTFTPSSKVLIEPAASNLWINLYNMVSGHSGQSCTVGKWKLEKGHKATDWSPCWEDIFTISGEELDVNI